MEKQKRRKRPTEKPKKEKSQNEAILNFINAPHLRINKDIVNTYGLNVALWIADIFSRWNWFRKENKLIDEYFYITQDKIRESTKLNLNKQTDIVRLLTEEKIIKVKKKGIPATNWYKLNINILIEKIEDLKTKSFEIERTHSPLKQKGLKEHNKYNSNKYNLNSLLHKDGVSSKHLTSINKIISFWNSLPRTQKHSIPETDEDKITKTYKIISLHIDNLLSGKPLVRNQNNSPFKPYKEFLAEYKIPSVLYTMTWIEKDIINMLQIFSDIQSDKSAKMSLSSVFWNNFAKIRGGGFSWFIHTAANTDLVD